MTQVINRMTKEPVKRILDGSAREDIEAWIKVLPQRTNIEILGLLKENNFDVTLGTLERFLKRTGLVELRRELRQKSGNHPPTPKSREQIRSTLELLIREKPNASDNELFEGLVNKGLKISFVQMRNVLLGSQLYQLKAELKDANGNGTPSKEKKVRKRYPKKIKDEVILKGKTGRWTHQELSDMFSVPISTVGFWIRSATKDREKAVVGRPSAFRPADRAEFEGWIRADPSRTDRALAKLAQERLDLELTITGLRAYLDRTGLLELRRELREEKAEEEKVEEEKTEEPSHTCKQVTRSIADAFHSIITSYQELEKSLGCRFVLKRDQSMEVLFEGSAQELTDQIQRFDGLTVIMKDVNCDSSGKISANLVCSLK